MKVTQLGSYSIATERLPDIQAVAILNDVPSPTARRRRRRYRPRVGGRFAIGLILSGEKEPIIVAQSHSRKMIEGKLRRITKEINSAVTAAQIDFDSRVQQLEARFNELYHAPGMPGFMRAQAGWDEVSARTA